MAPPSARALRTPPAARPSPLRDLIWLMAWVLRAAPWSTLVWACLILADAAFAALRLWATRGTVYVLVAFVRGRAAAALAARWFAIIAAVETGARRAALLRPYFRERVRVQAGACIQGAVLAHAARVPVEAFDVQATHDVARRRWRRHPRART